MCADGKEVPNSRKVPGSNMNTKPVPMYSMSSRRDYHFAHGSDVENLFWAERPPSFCLDETEAGQSP